MWHLEAWDKKTEKLARDYSLSFTRTDPFLARTPEARPLRGPRRLANERGAVARAFASHSRATCAGSLRLHPRVPSGL